MEDKVQSYSTTKKLFALLNNENIVISWDFEYLEELKIKYPDLFFVEMTEKNTPATVGALWDGIKFIY